MKRIHLVVMLFMSMLGVSQSDSTITTKTNDSSKEIYSLTYKELNIDNNDSFASYEILDKDIKGHSIFFVGENHLYRKSNSYLQLKLLKYLYKKTGLRNIIIEQGPSRAYLMNKYVETGDSALKKTLNDYSFPIYYDFCVELRKFNKTLPKNERIHIWGIDMERSIGSAAKALGSLIPKNKDVPDKILTTVESIIGMEGYYDNYYASIKVDSVTYDYWGFRDHKSFSGKRTYERIIEDYDTNKVLFKEYLGENYDLFNSIIEGVKGAKLWYEYKYDDAYQEWVSREEFMYKRFKGLIHAHPKEKFLGSFGRCHTPLEKQDKWCDLYQFRSLVNRINSSSDSLMNNKVLSIGSYYPDQSFFGVKEKDQLEAFSDITKNEKVYIFKVDSDSIYNDFRNKFQFIIINNRDQDEETKEKRFYGSRSRRKGNRSKGGFVFGARHINGTKLVDFNSILNQKGFPVLSDPIQAYQFSIVSVEGSEIFQYNFNFFRKPGEFSSVTGNKMRLSGYGGEFSYSYDIIPWKYVDLAVGPSFGAGIVYLKETLASAGTTGIFSSSPTNKMINPYLLVGGLAQLRLNFGSFSIGAKAGYDFDLSVSKWKRSNWEGIEESPSTKFTNYYYGIDLGFIVPN